ncbi:uncharacterized protein LOC116339051 isoform X2 [Contarinia nasturtii]|uniref:uncharacterized protein LOC116339051 isoform X2 n=1 Tax=Contarinia nasturtii TaxID=265458 RepID=UPI0012D3DE01|nr:uncharacterized protein LOC116339051 isoform X2 [Contarinia nasturtii]
MCSLRKMQLQISALILLLALTTASTVSHTKGVNKKEERLKPSSTSSTLSPLPPPSVIEVSLIDSIRRHYLALEIDLWHLMDSGIDTAYILQQMHNIHLTFFGEHFREFNVTFNDYAVDRQTQLISIIDTVNGFVSMTTNKCLHQNPLEFNETAAIEMAQRQLNLTHQIDRLFTLTETMDFYETIRNKAQLKQCDKNVMVIKSANQLIYEYYHDISMAELKAYALVQLSFMFFTVYNRGNFRKQAQDLRDKYLDRTRQTQDIVRHLLENSKRDIWRCDPNHYTVGTYEEVTNFLQGYIDNEVNLNEESTCQNTCEDYKATKNYRCFDGTYCALKSEGAERDRATCKGKIVDCQFMGNDLNVCTTPNQFSRRYDVLHYDNGNILGRNGTEVYEKCADESTRIQSWTRWVVKCANCFCLCDDQKHSERHFSLRDVVSDIKKNRVVSAVALRKFQGIFHLVIVERELKPYATLNVTNPTWHLYNAVEYFHIHDALVREGIDYHTLTWQNRSINLDTVEVPTGKVVTGVRFRVFDGAITLQVRATDFDFISGQLKNVDHSFWYMNDNSVERTEIPLDSLDIPTLSPEKSIPNVLTKRFVKFGPSDKYKDLAQTTIPFIDSQLVESHNPMPLSGVGLFWKAFPGYGGFVAPKILNYNYGAHIGALSKS